MTTYDDEADREREQQRAEGLQRWEEARAAELEEERANADERGHLAALQHSADGIEYARNNGLVDLRGRVLLNTVRERGYQAARKVADEWPMYLQR